MKIVKPIHRIFIWGLEGSRKSSLAIHIYTTTFKPKGYHLIALQTPSLEDLDKAIAAARSHEKTFLLLDDLTYRYHHQSTDFRLLAHKITLIRHYVGLAKDIALCTVAHYAQSVPPVLRLAHTYILTSLSTPYDQTLASKYFKERYLSLYRRLYLRYPNNVALVNWLGKHRLVATHNIYHPVQYMNTLTAPATTKPTSLPLKGAILKD